MVYLRHTKHARTFLFSRLYRGRVRCQNIRALILFSAVEDATATTACSATLRFDFVLRICASMPLIGVRRMEDVKRIDEANETHAVTGRRGLVIQIISGKQVVCKQVLWGGKYTRTPFHTR